MSGCRPFRTVRGLFLLRHRTAQEIYKPPQLRTAQEIFVRQGGQAKLYRLYSERVHRSMTEIYKPPD